MSRISKLVQQGRLTDVMGMLEDYRGEVERRAADAVQKLFGALPVASKGEVQDLARQIATLNQKFNDLSRQLAK